MEESNQSDPFGCIAPQSIFGDERITFETNYINSEISPSSQMRTFSNIDSLGLPSGDMDGTLSDSIGDGFISEMQPPIDLDEHKPDSEISAKNEPHFTDSAICSSSDSQNSTSPVGASPLASASPPTAAPSEPPPPQPTAQPPESITIPEHSTAETCADVGVPKNDSNPPQKEKEEKAESEKDESLAAGTRKDRLQRKPESPREKTVGTPKLFYDQQELVDVLGSRQSNVSSLEGAQALGCRLPSDVAVNFTDSPIVSYQCKYFTFSKPKIDPLAPNDVFEVVTQSPKLRFRFTKSAFMRVFPHVLTSKVYNDPKSRWSRIKPPAFAFFFLVPSSQSSTTPTTKSDAMSDCEPLHSVPSEDWPSPSPSLTDNVGDEQMVSLELDLSGDIGSQQSSPSSEIETSPMAKRKTTRKRKSVTINTPDVETPAVGPIAAVLLRRLAGDRKKTEPMKIKEETRKSLEGDTSSRKKPAARGSSESLQKRARPQEQPTDSKQQVEKPTLQTRDSQTTREDFIKSLGLNRPRETQTEFEVWIPDPNFDYSDEEQE